jgi:Ca2+-binding EF-hand superfamily protein
LIDASFQKVLSLYPKSPGVYSAYADWLATVGRFDEGISLLDQAREIDPHSDDVRSIGIRLIERRNAAGQIAVLNALDFDHDNRLSAAEMVAAPAVLAALDRNGDGKLSAEECGARLAGGFGQAARIRFMLSSPLLMALDADHDGEISASEIRRSEQALSRLDRDHSGSVEISELAPYYVVAVAVGLLRKWRGDRNANIKTNNLKDPSCRRLMIAADCDADGDVTFDELTNEVYYRADRDKNGIVTEAELDEAIRAGALGPMERRRINQ